MTFLFGNTYKLQALVASIILSASMSAVAAVTPQTDNPVDCPSINALQSATPVASLPYAFDYKNQQFKAASISLLDIPYSNEDWGVIIINLPISPEQNFISQTIATLSHLTAVYPKSNFFQVLNKNILIDDFDKAAPEKYTFQYCLYQAEGLPKTTVLAVSIPSGKDEILSSNNKGSNSIKRIKRLQKEIKFLKMFLSTSQGF